MATKKLTPLTAEEKELIKDYPIQDGHRKQYVKHPLRITQRSWIVVRVCTTGGYLKSDANFDSPVPPKVFKTEKEAQRACDIHNTWLMGDTVGGAKRIAAIIRASFVKSEERELREKAAKRKPMKSFIVHVQFHGFSPRIQARTKKEAMEKAIASLALKPLKNLVDKKHSSAEEW